MTKTTGFKQRPATIDPGERRALPIDGTMLRVAQADFPFTLELNGDIFTAELGDFWQAPVGSSFTTCYVTNPEGEGGRTLQVRLDHGTGTMGNTAVQLAGYIETSRRRVAKVRHGVFRALSHNGAGGRELVEIVPENRDRREITLRNPHSFALRLHAETNDDPGYYDADAVPKVQVDAPGLYLGPGERVTLEVQIALLIERPVYPQGGNPGNYNLSLEYWEEVFADA